MELNLSNISLLLSTYAVMVIISMDLGLPYNNLESKIYTNYWFQIAVLFSTGYLTTQDFNLTSFLIAIWLGLKFYGKNKN